MNNSGGGGESGWTSYLDQSYYSASQYQKDAGYVNGDYRRKGTKHNGNDEEEDLSMVSDASSGPPHFNEEGEEYFGEDGSSYSVSPGSKSAKKIEKKKKKHTSKQQHPTCIDDTASSPVSGFNKKNLDRAEDRVQGFSGSQHKGKSSFHKLFQSISEKTTSKKSGKY